MRYLLTSSAFAVALFVSSCGGGGGGGSSTPPPSGGGGSTPPPVSQDTNFNTKVSTTRFLSNATFGADDDEVDVVTGTESSDWFKREVSKPTSLNLPFVQDFITQPENLDSGGDVSYRGKQAPTFSFWRNAIEGEDQLRQRVAYSLSQILVISHNEGSSELFQFPLPVAHYQDILVTNAFGNFRDILEEITYSPAMGEYLTYRANRPADPDKGRVPDENYAREIMQLFTIGLYELNPDGTLKTDSSGNPIETYSNEDVTGLASVFTGLGLKGGAFWAWLGKKDLPADATYSRMIIYPNHHTETEKTFLGVTIPAGTSGDESIAIALDTLFEHPNVGPFIGRQMIQRLVTSNPSPAYVERVANAFNTGTYTLPDETTVGTGQRGDMQAFIAAILFDQEATQDPDNMASDFGKIREPVLRFTHFARAFDVSNVTPEHLGILWNTSSPQSLAQHPYKSPSVFNFYRPGYVPPGTESGDAGMTVPEFQITHTSSVSGYANFMSYFIFSWQTGDKNEAAQTSFIPDYSDERAIADDPVALVDHLDEKIVNGQMSMALKDRVVTAVENVPLTDENNPDYDGAYYRIGIAITMIMTSSDYIVQR